MGRPTRILLLTQPFPSRNNSNYGIHVLNRYSPIAQDPEFEIEVLSPQPYVPAWWQRQHGWTRLPAGEVVEGIPVRRPRYITLPLVGKHFLPALMHRPAILAADEIQGRFPFDMIDAQWIYPMGCLAAGLGRRYAKPVVMTGHGSDVHTHARGRLVGRQVRRALDSATALIAVSEFIADQMRTLGAADNRLDTISNGVDSHLFRPRSKEDSLRQLGLNPDQSLLLTVGELTENKGFHILARSVAELVDEFPKLQLVIVGGRPAYGPAIESPLREVISQLGIGRRITLVGPKPHSEMPLWYNAADAFVLMSDREGASCVLLEALASGIPVVSTSVGNAPDLLSADLGILLSQRSAAAGVAALRRTLKRQWDSEQISRAVRERTWERRADEIKAVYSRMRRGA